MDPYRAYNFKVKISGIDDSQFHFTKCSSFKVTVENQEFREAGNNQVTQQIPTRVKYEPITLSYGVTDSRELWGWLKKAADGKAERKNVSVTVLDNDGQTKRDEWQLVNAWPQSWEYVELDAGGNELAIASMTLVFDEMKRD